jgi:hypothetical protein
VARGNDALAHVTASSSRSTHCMAGSNRTLKKRST